MTLPEILVIMIVAAIVFMSVMDGFGLFKKYTHEVADRLSGNMKFYDRYYRLENIITTADSLTGNDNRVLCWKNGSNWVNLSFNDSTVTAGYGSVVDTLIINADQMEVHYKDNKNTLLDSLIITVSVDASKLGIAFSINTPAQIMAAQTITDKEKEYEYR